MDWSELRSAGESWLDCGDTQGAHDLSHWAMDFIPADPNKKADAEWLKERGWQYFDDDTETLFSPVNMDFMFCDGVVFMRDGDEVKASRMYVALVEAAMEAMKHGE